MIDENSFLRQTSKRNLRIAPGKLEESGKILEKDLWVRAHSRETPLKRFEGEIAPVDLKGLNELSSVKCFSPRSVEFFSSLAQPLRFDSSGVSK